jgi:DNA repair protein RadA/Sms
MKTQSLYICQNCGQESPKWLGKCPSCEAWNSFEEDSSSLRFSQNKLSKTPRNLKIESKSPTLLSGIENKNASRILTSLDEFNRVLGGGLVKDSIVLLSGEPGIGKSTLTLQVAVDMAEKEKVLLISAEESLEQIKERSLRMGGKQNSLHVLNEYNLETIIKTINEFKPTVAIIDSIQMISSLDVPSIAGSVNQVRYCAEQLMEVAKTKKIAIILIGHVTKDGSLAGPKILEHIVDTVLYLEGDSFHQFRMLKATKNRFGNCQEVGIFEMRENGMIEVKNPSSQFLEGKIENSFGSAIAVIMEGTRPFLVEVQALTSTSSFGYPKRTANGFDINRLQILIAVLEKYGRLNLQNQDVFINIAGGIKIKDPSADLAIIMAIASSLLKKPLPPSCAIFGEVGLCGEIRKVPFSDKREKEAIKMGFEKIISSKTCKEIKEAVKNLY